MHGVELFGFAARQVDHAGSDDLQASAFEAGVDLADHVLGNCVGLDDGEGAFDSHLIFLEDLKIFARKNKTPHSSDLRHTPDSPPGTVNRPGA
ncbi:hypothetical protein D3C86_1773620 [compost metagenome]